MYEKGIKKGEIKSVETTRETAYKLLRFVVHIFQFIIAFDVDIMTSQNRMFRGLKNAFYKCDNKFGYF